jgi:diacylglycerol kinase family enzyme
MQLLVGNPTAQSGKNARRIDEARRLLYAAGIDHDFLPTRPGGQTVAAVARALSNDAYSAVIAMGGDGTFAEVGKGLLASGASIPMAMLPTGTANDQGRSFGMDSTEADLPRNVAVVAAGHTTPLDAGRITAFGSLDDELGTDFFFDSAGWGFSALVLRMRNEDRRLVNGVPILRELYRDQAVYAGAVVRALMLTTVEEQPFEAEVTTPAGTVYYENLTDLILKNTRVYAGMWVLDPTGSSEDGELDLVPFRGREELLMRGVIHHEQVPLHEPNLEAVGLRLTPPTRAARFDIRLHARPLAQAPEAQIDGEEWIRAERYRVDTLRHAIRLVVPAELGGG